MSRSGVPAVLSHKAGEVSFVPCSLPRRGQLPPPAALLKVELRPSGTTPFTAGLHHYSSFPHHSLWIFLYFFALHIPDTSTGFYVLYLWWVYVSSTSPSNLILITLLQFLCHRDAHLDFGETAQNDPMVKRLQTSFIRKLERCQQIEAWSGFTVQELGTAWIVPK